MTDSNQNSTILVVTEDIELLSSLLENNTTEFEFISRESVQEVLDSSDLLTNNHIVIIDIDSINGGSSAVIEQTVNLKKSDPTQVIMLVGNPEQLAELLRSNIQPIIYRAFNKPIHPNQIFLSFGSASASHGELIEKQAAGEDLLSIGPAENKTNVETIAAQQKSKPAIYAGVGVLALGAVAWLLLGNNSDTTPDQVAPTIISSTPEAESNLVTTDNDVTQINFLNQEAAKALLEGRQITPENDNALHYYDQVLLIDPYDLTAYEGKKSLALDLKNSYQDLVDNAEFDQALETINALQSIEPLDTSNYALREDLEVNISEYVDRIKNTGTAAEIEQTTIALAKIGSESQSSRTAAAALQNEKVLLEKIDQALSQNNLIPPTTGNAYAIVSDALQKNAISKVNFTPRITALSEKLSTSANSSLEQDNLEEAEKYTALVKRLDVDPQSLASLETRIEERKTALAEQATQQTEELTEEIVEQEASIEEAPAVAKIIPAKIISRASPRYPARALNRDITGWVSIGFTIDINGIPQDINIVESEPEDTFDDAALTAVKKWRFSPAMNEETKTPVESYVSSTKLQFQIDD